MDFDNTVELVDYLVSIGKVEILESGGFRWKKAVKGRKKKELPPEALRMARRMGKILRENFDFINPDEDDLNRWASDIEKLHRIDGEKWEAIEYVIEWVGQDSFWVQNIRSGKTLREKMETLKIRIKSGERTKEEIKKKTQSSNRYQQRKTTSIPDYVIDERTGRRGNELL